MKEKQISVKIHKHNKISKIDKKKCKKTYATVEEIDESDEIEEMEEQPQKYYRKYQAEEEEIMEEDDVVRDKCMISLKAGVTNEKCQDREYQIDKEDRTIDLPDQIKEEVTRKVSPSLKFQLFDDSRKIEKQFDLNENILEKGEKVKIENEEEEAEENQKENDQNKCNIEEQQNNINESQLQLRIDQSISENINNIKQMLPFESRGNDESYEEDQNSSIEANENQNDIVQQLLGNSLNDSAQTHISHLSFLNSNPQSQILTYSIQRDNYDDNNAQEQDNDHRDLHLQVQDEEDFSNEGDELINVAFYQNNNTQTQPSQIVGISQMNIVEYLQLEPDENHIHTPHSLIVSPAYFGIYDGEESDEENDEDGPPFGWEHWFDNDDDEGYFGWINNDTDLNLFLFSNQKEDHIRGR